MNISELLKKASLVDVTKLRNSANVINRFFSKKIFTKTECDVSPVDVVFNDRLNELETSGSQEGADITALKEDVTTLKSSVESLDKNILNKITNVQSLLLVDTETLSLYHSKCNSLLFPDLMINKIEFKNDKSVDNEFFKVVFTVYARVGQEDDIELSDFFGIDSSKIHSNINSLNITSRYTVEIYVFYENKTSTISELYAIFS